MATTRSDTVHAITATLRDVDPPVWRQLRVRSDSVLADVVAAVVTALGWDGSARHQLVTPRLTTYGTPDFKRELGFERRTEDERKYVVSDALPDAGSTARLEYGSWLVDLAVDAVSTASPDAVYSETVAGEGTAPSDVQPSAI